MAVYVDQPLFRFRGMVMCHMWADSLDELHAMADRLGLKRAWFQGPPKARWAHYDVSTAVRARAIAFGAVETDRYGALEHLARLAGDRRKLEQIAAVRAQRTTAALHDVDQGRGG